MSVKLTFTEISGYGGDYQLIYLTHVHMNTSFQIYYRLSTLIKLKAILTRCGGILFCKQITQ